MTKRQSASKKRTTFEVGVLAASIAAIAAVVIALIVSGLRPAPSEPELRATVTTAGASSGGFAYRVTVRNDGGKTAENVVIEVTAGEETREVEILAVARGDEESATVVFPSATGQQAKAAVLAYSEPAR